MTIQQTHFEKSSRVRALRALHRSPLKYASSSMITHARITPANNAEIISATPGVYAAGPVRRRSREIPDRTVDRGRY